MGLFSVIFFAANAASRCAGTGPGVMIVPATCTLLYTSSEGFELSLYVLAKEVDPLRDFLGLVLGDCHDECTG